MMKFKKRYLQKWGKKQQIHLKKNKIILIGTNNKGKFKELSYLLPKRLKKISPSKLKIKSPKESGKSFLANSKIKANYFSKISKITSISDHYLTVI